MGNMSKTGIKDHSFTTDVQLVGVGRPPLPFFENQKKWPDFGKKYPDAVHP